MLMKDINIINIWQKENFRGINIRLMIRTTFARMSF